MSEREQQALQKRLQECLKRPENLTCSECTMRLPRWASTSLGVFFCTNCSGSHRGLGVHISKVKSTTLDKWTEEQVAFMEGMGNARANGFWEAELQTGAKPGPGSGRDACERFIKNKYERGRYKDSSRSGPEEVAQVASPPVETPIEPEPTREMSSVGSAAVQQNGIADLLSLDLPAPTNQPAAEVGGSQWSDFNTGSGQTANQWSDFTAPPGPGQAASEQTIADDSWGDFASAPTNNMPPADVQPAQKPEISKNDIMNLFDTPAQAHAMPGMGGGMMGLNELQGNMVGGFGQQAPPNVQGQAFPGAKQHHAMYQQAPMFQQQNGAAMGGMMPQQMGGMMPQQMGGMMPQQMGGMTPQQMGGMMPQQMGGMTPQPMGAQIGGPLADFDLTPRNPPEPDTQNIPEFKW